MHAAARMTISALAAAVCLVGGGVAGADSAETDRSEMVNGALSLVGGCMSPDRDAVAACTQMQNHRTVSPLMLRLNPAGTYLVVLGAGLTEDGQIAPVLEDRLHTARRLAAEHPSAPILVTGGAPKNGRTEAAAMRDWLIGAGIDPARVSVEDTSGSTAANAAHSVPILRERGAGGAVLITGPDHMKRALIEFRDAVDGAFPIAGAITG